MEKLSQNKNVSNKDQKIEVLVITPQYAPDFGPSAPIYTALCEDLQQIGCNVTVITAFPHYANAGAIFKRSKKLIEADSLNGVRIIRTYVYTVPKGSLWRRLLYQASYNFFASLALFKVKTPDIVFADAPTLWSGLPLTLRSILGGTPFIYIIHDIYPDVLERLDMLKNQRFLNLIEKVEEFFYRRAAQISVLSQGFKDNLVRKGVPAEKISIIPVCVDIDFIKPLPRENDYQKQWGLENKFVVLYAGNIGFSQGLETVIQTAELLRDKSEIMFLIVGDGAMKPQLQTIVDAAGLSNVRLLPFQPREAVPLIYALSDICLISLKRDIVVESVPSKTYSIMASGRPFIATVDRNSEVGVLVESANCGLCVESENAQGLAKAILKLYGDDNLRSEMGQQGRQYVVEKYSRRKAAEQYYRLVQISLKRGKNDSKI
jgi:colanic acid biosynthesis glycosyl transferase WcaI